MTKVDQGLINRKRSDKFRRIGSGRHHIENEASQIVLVWTRAEDGLRK